MKTLCCISILAAIGRPLYAVDGVVLINQNAALAGNVTPGDTPGFPVTISVPGSYKLSSNLTVPDANTTAIQIMVDDVTIDLNGFAIAGPTVCGGSPTTCSNTGNGSGISAFIRSRITVLNGAIHGMGSSGVFVFGSSATRVENIHATGNGSTGIISGGIISSCNASFNGGDGINAIAARVSGNVVIQNAGIGISIVHAIVLNNQVENNGADGISEAGTGSGSLFSGNSVAFNAATGITALCPSLVTGNSALNNKGGDIFTVGAGCIRANNSPAP